VKIHIKDWETRIILLLGLYKACRLLLLLHNYSTYSSKWCFPQVGTHDVTIKFKFLPFKFLLTCHCYIILIKFTSLTNIYKTENILQSKSAGQNPQTKKLSLSSPTRDNKIHQNINHISSYSPRGIPLWASDSSIRLSADLLKSKRSNRSHCIADNNNGRFTSQSTGEYSVSKLTNRGGDVFYFAKETK
jgi:hypothetical protein